MAVKNTALIAAAVDLGLVEAETVAELTVKARRERAELLDLLCLHGRFPPSALYQALAQRRGLPYLALEQCQVDGATMRKLPVSLMQRHTLMPVTGEGATYLLVADPDDHAGIEMARRVLGELPALALGEPDAIASLVEHWLRRQQGIGGDPGEVSPESTDYVGLLDAVFKRAFLARASDIHVEPGAETVRVRLRVDGRLRDHPRLFSAAEGAGLISRIKVLAGMDIAESREPQDGGLRYQVDAHAPFDVRVATAPTRFGERATLRLMGESAETLSLESIGMGAAALAEFRRTIRRPHGIVLITGPTGSGKSTTLYAALQELVAPETNVLTVEDPIERVLAGASQTQVGGKMDFAAALRAFLRHDPDIIMVGEIRDLETADVALKAALTGHLVFSTLHTNSAVAAVTRLADMGVERFLIGATLAAVIAQRLVRRLCPRCKQRREPDARERALLGDSAGAAVWAAAGCPACLGSGYRGRVGLFETLWIGDTLAQAISEGASEAGLVAAAAAFESLWADGLRKVAAGVTTFDEVLRVVQPDRPPAPAPRER